MIYRPHCAVSQQQAVCQCICKKRTAAPGVLFWFTRLSTPLSDIFIPQLNVVIVNFTSLQMEIGMTSEIA